MEDIRKIVREEIEKKEKEDRESEAYRTYRSACSRNGYSPYPKPATITSSILNIVLPSIAIISLVIIGCLSLIGR